MEIPVTGLEVVRNRRIVDHEARSITRLSPEVLGYVLSTNLETGRVTCLLPEGTVFSMAYLQEKFPEDSVYVRSSGQE